MNFIKKNWKGVLLCLMIAIPSWILGKFFPIVGGPVFAILLGMVITLLVSDKSALQSGITFVSKKNPAICCYFTWFWNESLCHPADRKTIASNHSCNDHNIPCCCLGIT